MKQNKKQTNTITTNTLFSKVARHKINIQNSTVFLWNSNELLENECEEKYHLQLHNNIKYLEINLTKDVQFLYTKTMKSY